LDDTKKTTVTGPSSGLNWTLPSWLPSWYSFVKSHQTFELADEDNTTIPLSIAFMTVKDGTTDWEGCYLVHINLNHNTVIIWTDKVNGGAWQDLKSVWHLKSESFTIAAIILESKEILLTLSQQRDSIK
jgi:hypothetical protein